VYLKRFSVEQMGKTKKKVKKTSSEEKSSLPDLSQLPDPSSKVYVNLADVKESLQKKGYVVTDTSNNSLTVPLDMVPRDIETAKVQARESRRQKMTPEQFEDAIKGLYRTFPMVEKRWSDPPINNQSHCLLAFQPARGARPDADGLFGYVKVRGTFPSENEADVHAEGIIENVDSYHGTYIGLTGQPLPLCRDSPDDEDKFSLEVNHVGFKQKLQSEMTTEMKERRNQEKKDIEELQVRTKKAKEKEESIIRGEVDHKERYITLRVKRSNLIFSLYEMVKTIKRYKDTLNETVDMISAMDVTHPEFKDTFHEEYAKTARLQNIADTPKENFIMKYLAGPIPFNLDLIPDTLPFIDDEPQLISPFDPNSVNPHLLAEEMAYKTKKGLSSLHDLDRKKRREGILSVVDEKEEEKADEPPTSVTPDDEKYALREKVQSATPFPRPVETPPVETPPVETPPVETPF